MSRIGLFCCLVVLYYVTNVRAIRFYLEPGQRRCFTEELPSSSTITGETKVTGTKGDMDIDVWVTTLKGKVLYHKRAAEHGKFTFETPALPRDRQESDDYDYGGEDSEEEDTYRVCLEHQQNPSRSHPTGTKRAIMFKLNQSFNGGTQRSETAAKTSDTDRLQESMQSMHRTLSGMIGDLSKLQMRDKALTARLVKTGRRVSGMAIFSLIVTLGISALQFRYYRGYFKQKKLC